jgi:beta-alanine--pyruvate transaminase
MHSLRGRPNVIDIRAIGLVAGIELSSRPDAAGARGYDVMVDCFNRGLVLRSAGDALALSPPLIVERAQIDDMVAIIGDALKRVA